jgi:hypothetical protein
MIVASRRILLALVCVANHSGCAPGPAAAAPASPQAAAPAPEPAPTAEPPAPAPAPVDLATVAAVRFRIVAMPDRKSWVHCGKRHVVGALEVEVLDAGEPPPRMLLLVSCPAGVRDVKLAVGETLAAALHHREQPWPDVAGLPADLPRRQVASFTADDSGGALASASWIGLTVGQVLARCGTPDSELVMSDEPPGKLRGVEFECHRRDPAGRVALELEVHAGLFSAERSWASELVKAQKVVRVLDSTGR